MIYLRLKYKFYKIAYMFCNLKRFSLSLILCKLIKIVCVLTVNQSNLVFVIEFLIFIYSFIFIQFQYGDNKKGLSKVASKYFVFSISKVQKLQLL